MAVSSAIVENLGSSPERRLIDMSVLGFQRRRAWLLNLGLIFAFWTTLGVLDATQLYVGMEVQGMHHSFVRILSWQLIGCWYGWVFFTPVIQWLAVRYPLTTPAWKQHIFVHSSALITFALVHTAVFVSSSILIQPFDTMSDTRSFWQMYMGRLTGQFHLELIVYGMILGTYYAFDYYRRFRERELRATQLESQLTLAQLNVLKMQLQPHFLFNTLNGIASLVRDNKNKAAVNMIAGLSDLLRNSLQNAGRHQIPLREELDFLELYLDLQQMRFAERLSTTMSIDPAALDALVPNLILQPLVENAIRHGLAERESGGVIEIVTKVHDGALNIKVRNDGEPLPLGWLMDSCQGIGLANTRQRLEQLHGEDYSFNLSNAVNGVEVEIVLPLQFAETGPS